MGYSKELLTLCIALYNVDGPDGRFYMREGLQG